MLSEVFRWVIEASILEILDSKLIPRASLTWKSFAFPTRQILGAPLFITAFKTSSFSTERPSLLVMPKAVIFELSGFSSTEVKYSESVGLAPGHPPSI